MSRFPFRVKCRKETLLQAHPTPAERRPCWQPISSLKTPSRKKTLLRASPWMETLLEASPWKGDPAGRPSPLERRFCWTPLPPGKKTSWKPPPGKKTLLRAFPWTETLLGASPPGKETLLKAPLPWKGDPVYGEMLEEQQDVWQED